MRHFRLTDDEDKSIGWVIKAGTENGMFFIEHATPDGMELIAGICIQDGELRLVHWANGNDENETITIRDLKE